MNRRTFLRHLITAVVGVLTVPVLSIFSDEDEAWSWGKQSIEVTNYGRYLYVLNSSGKATLIGEFTYDPVEHVITNWTDTHIEMVANYPNGWELLNKLVE